MIIWGLSSGTTVIPTLTQVGFPIQSTQHTLEGEACSQARKFSSNEGFNSQSHGSLVVSMQKSTKNLHEILYLALSKDGPRGQQGVKVVTQCKLGELTKILLFHNYHSL